MSPPNSTRNLHDNDHLRHDLRAGSWNQPTYRDLGTMLLALPLSVTTPLRAGHAPAAQASRASRVLATAVEQLDVVQRAQAFLASATGYYTPIDPEFYDDQFVFRAPSIGPLNRRDYFNTMTTLQT